MEFYIGSIFAWGGNFAPRGTMACEGQLLSIAQNTALFSILGTTYGGDGVTTFALPDLRGRTPVGWGQGPGLSSVSLGEVYGQESVTLSRNNLPAVTAHLNAGSSGDSESPSGAFLGTPDGGNLYTQGTPNCSLAADSMISGLSGSNVPVQTVGPRLGVYFVIATEGIFPSRS